VNGFFIDDDMLSFSVLSIMNPMTAGANVMEEVEASVAQKKDDDGNPVSGVFVVSIADVGSTDAPGETPIVEDYMNAVVEIMAEDEPGLWTTQSFNVRRNRKPTVRAQGTAAENRPDNHYVGTIGDMADGLGYFIDYGTDDQRANTGSEEIKASAIFADDAHDTVRFSDQFILEDALVTVELSDDHGTAKLTSIEPGTTLLTMAGLDTGDLRSDTTAGIDVVVDRGPVPTDKEVKNIQASLSQDVPGTTGPQYVLLDVQSYFEHDEDTDEGESYFGESSDETIASIAAAALVEDVGSYRLVIQLKAVGEATITIRITEGDSSNANVGLQQSVTRSFTLSVVP
jgi:hypothetical protein